MPTCAFKEEGTYKLDVKTEPPQQPSTYTNERERLRERDKVVPSGEMLGRCRRRTVRLRRAGLCLKLFPSPPPPSPSLPHSFPVDARFAARLPSLPAGSAARAVPGALPVPAHGEDRCREARELEPVVLRYFCYLLSWK